MTIQERRASQKRRGRAGFGLRRLADIVASAFRRVFAESVGAPLPRTAYAGAAARITACNCTPDEAFGAVRVACAAMAVQRGPDGPPACFVLGTRASRSRCGRGLPGRASVRGVI